MDIENSIAISDQEGVFSGIAKFQEVQFMADFLSKSDLIPKEFRSKPANVMIALNMAQRMKADPFMVMQNLYVIHGRPAFSAQFLISCMNHSNRFGSLNFEFTEGKKEIIEYEYLIGDYGNKKVIKGKQEVKNDSMRAYAVDKQSGETVYGPTVSLEMAIKEGWYSKTGSKWKTMPELMLTYRAAAFFIRTKAPEISMGMPSQEELIDMGAADVVFDNEPNDKLEKIKTAMKSAPAKQEPEKEKKGITGGQKQAAKAQPKPKQEPEAKQEESEIDMVEFLKTCIDSCSDIDSLEECGVDIKHQSDDDMLDEGQLLEVRQHYNAALKQLKNQ